MKRLKEWEVMDGTAYLVGLGAVIFVFLVIAGAWFVSGLLVEWFHR